jgi:hypothetical protein
MSLPSFLDASTIGKVYSGLPIEAIETLAFPFADFKGNSKPTMVKQSDTVLLRDAKYFMISTRLDHGKTFILDQQFYDNVKKALVSYFKIVMKQAIEEVLVNEPVEEDNISESIILSGLEALRNGFTAELRTSYVVDKVALLKYVAIKYHGSMQAALQHLDDCRQELESYWDELDCDELYSLLRRVTIEEL